MQMRSQLFLFHSEIQTGTPHERINVINKQSRLGQYRTLINDLGFPCVKRGFSFKTTAM